MAENECGTATLSRAELAVTIAVIRGTLDSIPEWPMGPLTVAEQKLSDALSAMGSSVVGGTTSSTEAAY